MSRNKSDQFDEVVVTGLGAITPIGNNVSDFWEALLKGKSGASNITLFDASKFKTKFACEVKGFDAKEQLSPKEARIYDRYTQLALVSVDEAMGDAQLKVGGFDPERSGVIWASGNGGFQTFEEGVKSQASSEDLVSFNPYFIPKVLVNMAGGIIAMKNGFKGITFTPVSACASANSALIEAYHHIRWGNADVMIAGGSDAAITSAGVGGFNALRALSQRNDEPKKASRPFDSNRDGFVIGEGAGALILESRSHAVSRGARIYAELKGGAMTSDAYHLTASHPEGEGAQRAMKLTMSNAHLAIRDIDHINAHATSTMLGDLSEAKAIQHVFGVHKPKVTATKSMTGHLLGAAGAVEAVATVLSIHKNIIPATINLDQKEQWVADHLDVVTNKPYQGLVEHALSNAFGFGGHNATVLFSKYKEN